MDNPFVRASCGCVVIPLRRSDGVGDRIECILLRDCDGDGDWSFHLRSFPPWKVVVQPGCSYYSPNTPEPRPLSEAEIDSVIKGFGVVVALGYQARSLARILTWVSNHQLLPMFEEDSHARR